MDGWKEIGSQIVKWGKLPRVSVREPICDLVRGKWIK